MALCESNTVPTDSGLCRFHYSLGFVFTIASALGGIKIDVYVAQLVPNPLKAFHRLSAPAQESQL